MAGIGGLVCGRSGATRVGGVRFEDLREGEGRPFGFTLEGYPVILLALIKVALKSKFIPSGQVVIKRVCRAPFCIVFIGILIGILDGWLP